jgi:hypothetical protein
MTKLEELKATRDAAWVAYAAAYAAARDADIDADIDAANVELDAALDTYEAELKKIQEEKQNDLL